MKNSTAEDSIAEDVAAYWNRRPCNVNHGTAPIGSEAWSEEVTHRKYFVEPHIPAFAQFQGWRGKRVLEIGCGIGTDTIQFAEAGALVDAIDLSHESVRLASTRATRYGYPISFTVANAQWWIPVGPFDLAYSFGVLHHTPLPECVLLGAHMRLKDDGELRIMLYAKWSIKHLLGIQPEAQAGCPIVRWYSAREARKLVESCGFKVESIEKTHIFPWRVKDYIEHRYVKAWPWSWMPKRMFEACERLLGHHLLIVAKKA